MRQFIIELAEAAVQLTVMVALYPIWFIIGLYARKTRRDRFVYSGRVCGMYLFPAFGRWYLPMIWLNWHY